MSPGACNYAIMLRHMLVHESQDELHLLSAIPDWWLGAGQEIRVERLPTYFGEMNLTVRGTPEGVQIQCGPAQAKPAPADRADIASVTTLGRDRSADVQIEQRPDQTQRWDFPTIVAQYQATCDWTKPNAVSLTTGKPVQCSHALPGYGAELANDGRSDDSDSYWATDVQQHPGDAWWQVDLEQPVDDRTSGRCGLLRRSTSLRIHCRDFARRHGLGDSGRLARQPAALHGRTATPAASNRARRATSE